jgi:hypothetical protein
MVWRSMTQPDMWLFHSLYDYFIHFMVWRSMTHIRAGGQYVLAACVFDIVFTNMAHCVPFGFKKNIQSVTQICLCRMVSILCK